MILSVVVTVATLALSLANVWPTLNSWAQIERSHGLELEETEQTEIFGYSETGRAIDGYVFGQGNDCLILIGGIHGSEKGTVALMDRLVDYLTDRPEIVPEGKRVVILPLANPDGFYDREDKLNANEVNLNRNFKTTDWIQQEDEDDPETYAGPAPFSEVESLIIREVAGTCPRGLMVSYHSQGALVSPEADDASTELARWYADKTGYEFFDEWEYAGTATRWLVEATGNPAITVELTNHEDSDWRINKEALLELIAR